MDYMLPDIRLDFISNIDSEYILTMTNFRNLFITLDDALRKLGATDDASKEGASRCLSLARTNAEIALQYTIKALCIMGEVKE